jgi:SMC proteins Flexible Hinge Domain
MRNWKSVFASASMPGLINEKLNAKPSSKRLSPTCREFFQVQILCCYLRSPRLLTEEPGVKGRVVDQCRPTSRKFDTAISVVLGRNIDSVIVDTEKTAIDCIEVRFVRAVQPPNCLA